MRDQLIYGKPDTKYRFDVEVMDRRTGERSQIYVDANTKASAGKRATDLGYTVFSVSFA